MHAAETRQTLTCALVAHKEGMHNDLAPSRHTGPVLCLSVDARCVPAHVVWPTGT